MFLQAQEKGDALKTLEIIGHHDKLVDHLVQHPQFLDFLPSIFPFNSKTRISSDFEHRIHPLTKAAQFHAGIDFPLGKELLLWPLAMPGCTRLNTTTRYPVTV